MNNQLHIAEKLSESNQKLIKVCETSSLNSSISNLRSTKLLNNLGIDNSSKERIRGTMKKSGQKFNRHKSDKDQLYIGAIHGNARISLHHESKSRSPK